MRFILLLNLVLEAEETNRGRRRAGSQAAEEEMKQSCDKSAQSRSSVRADLHHTATDDHTQTSTKESRLYF